MPKIVTSFTGQEIDVSEHEEGVLRGLGVVVDTRATTEEGRRLAAERAPAPPPATPTPPKRPSRAKTKPTPPTPASVETPAGQQPAGDDDSQEG